MSEHEKRIRDFLSERTKMRGLCPEQIAGANDSRLNASDLRALLADLDEARAALTAAKAGGWVAVPVEPTDEMLAAGKKQAHSNNSVGAKCLRIYAAMLAARPLPTPPKEQAA